MTPSELRARFRKEKGIKGPMCDVQPKYIYWLESQIKELIEENKRLNNPEDIENIGNLFKIFITKLDGDSVLYTITDETGDLIRNYGKIDLFITGLKKLLKTNSK